MTAKPCLRCGMIARLDRTGHCRLCQYEQAYGRVYINWRKFAATWAARGWHWSNTREVKG